MSAIAAPQIEIENLRAILPPSVAKTTAVYGVIKNTGDEFDTLIRISSNAGMVMLHQTEIISGQALAGTQKSVGSTSTPGPGGSVRQHSTG